MQDEAPTGMEHTHLTWVCASDIQLVITIYA